MLEILAPKSVWNFSECSHLFPTHGWVRDYVAYAIQCTDAPPLYHVLSALGIMSVAIADRVDLYVHNEPTPLHMYILMVGESGTRKSAAMKRAIRTVQPVFDAYGLSGRLWYPEAASVEGILECLGQDPNRLMILSEWTELHRQSSSSSYWKGSSEFFNIAYDAMPLTRNRAKITTAIQRPRLSILGASTPGLIRQATTLHDWTAGKLARYLVGYQFKPESKSMDSALELPQTIVQLQDNFQRFFAAPLYQYELSAQAWTLFQDWKHDSSWKEAQTRFGAEHLAPALNRIDAHVMRIAALYQASMDFPHNYFVGEEAMTKAIQLAWECAYSLLDSFPVIEDRGLAHIVKIRNIIAMHGNDGIRRRLLLRKTNCLGTELDKYIGALLERAEVRIETRENKSTWYFSQADHD